MADGFPIRNRGVHLLDHIRRLELISSARSPQQPHPLADATATTTTNANRMTDSSGNCVSSPRRALSNSTSFRPLATPQFARDFATRFENSPPFSSKKSASHATTAVAAAADHNEEDFANVFGNLSAWIDASLHKCVFHAGFAKIRLYALFLQLFLDEIVVAPLHENHQVKRAIQQLNAYVQYLSSDTGDPLAGQAPLLQARGSALPSTTIPRQPLLRTDRLSLKANFQSAALVPQMLSSRSKSTATTTIQSPRLLRSPKQPTKEDQQQQDLPHKQPKPPTLLTYPKHKKIVQLSNHEERILELALCFEETLRKMGGGGSQQNPSKASTTTTKKKPKDALSAAVEYTTQWLLLASDEKHRVLRQRKRQLSCQGFFPCSTVYSSVAPSLISNSTNSKASDTSTSDLELISALIAARASSRKPADDRHNHKMGLASYFSLVVLCLHESIRRVGVFSLELAEFAWKVLCEDAILLCEDMFATIMNNQKQAQQQLHRLKQEKMALQQQILDLESKVQRLHTQNMLSLTMCNLEKQEFLHLEREEQWHGHCKALIVSCIAQLQGSVNAPTWLQKHSPSAALDDDIDLEEEGHEDDDNEDSDEDGLGSQTSLQRRLGDYRRLAPGFAAFHFRNRFQVTYITHLALLCRSYLHLHERRGVRDVMNSTSISSGASAPGTSGGGSNLMDHRHSQTATPGLGDDWSHLLPENNSAASFFLGSAPLTNNPMEKISLSELHTLREINDALRAIEVLYAETGATSSGQLGSSSSSPSSTDSETNSQRRRDSDVVSTRPTLRRPRAQQRSFGTQFPVMGTGSARSFLRSLSYCTIAATTLSSSNPNLSSSFSPLFLPAGASARLQAEIEMHHENVIVTSVGSGRRRSSARFKDATQAAASSSSSSSRQQQHHHQQQQPQIRLNKAMRKLPRHMKELLVLPLLVDPENGGGGDGAAVEPFPALDPARSIATCLSTHEIVDKIHWIYRMALDNVCASSSSGSSYSAVGGGLSDLLPISLSATTIIPHGGSSSQTAVHLWTCENFVEFVYSGILEAENGDLERCEREFVRFFASVQLLLTSNNSSSSSSHTGPNASSPSAAASTSPSSSVASETISLFALIAKMQFVQIEHSARKERRTLPSRVFPVLFYCQRVLLHVSISKRKIENSGFSLDVWTLQTPDELNNWGNANQSSLLRCLPTKRALATTAGNNSGSNSNGFTPFVLLESVKVLMLHVVSFVFASDVASMLEERYQYLLDKSTVVSVSLLTPVTPGPYNLNSSSSGSSGSSPAGIASNVPNGQLAEAYILPMDLVVTTTMRLWLHVHFDVEHRLGITLQGGLTDKGDDCLSFDEFVRVMTAEGSPQQQHTAAAAMSSGPGSGPGSGGGGGGASITRARFAQIYTAAQSKACYSSNTGGAATNGTALHWKQLLAAIVDNVDIMGMHERFLSVDFRSIQQYLSAPGNSAINPIGPLSSWLLGSNTSAGTMRNSSSATTTTTTQALLKSWQLHQKSMGDHILLAFQAESALDGVRCWQTSNLRLDKVQNLLRGVSEHRVSTTTRKLRRGGNSLVGAAAGTAVSTETPTSNSKEKSIGNIPRNVEDEERLQELEPDALGIAWKAYQLLQWDHARAHQFADQVRLKQQRMQKNINTSNLQMHSSTLTGATAPGTLSSPPQQQTLVSPPGKVEEVRSQRPLAPTKTAQRPRRS